MRALTLKLMTVLFAAVLVSGCSSTSTSGSGDASSGVSASGAETGSVTGGDMNGAMAMGNVVYFDFDQAAIRSDARDVLMAQAARLKKGGNATLEGHADERGTREYNMALGERRAKAVRDFLVIQGVDRSQLEVVSFGEERPAAAGSNDAAWAKNRRVEIR